MFPNMQVRETTDMWRCLQICRYETLQMCGDVSKYAVKRNSRCGDVPDMKVRETEDMWRCSKYAGKRN
jgi:uncharacterized Fe-S center protein